MVNPPLASQSDKGPAECLVRWLDWLLPLVQLVAPGPVDPVRGLALPGGEEPDDSSTISAYYLSFYE